MVLYRALGDVQPLRNFLYAPLPDQLLQHFRFATGQAIEPFENPQLFFQLFRGHVKDRGEFGLGRYARRCCDRNGPFCFGEVRCSELRRTEFRWAGRFRYRCGWIGFLYQHCLLPLCRRMSEGRFIFCQRGFLLFSLDVFFKGRRINRRTCTILRCFYCSQNDRAVCVFIPAHHHLIEHCAGNDKKDHIHQKGEGHRQPLQQGHP